MAHPTFKLTDVSEERVDFLVNCLDAVGFKYDEDYTVLYEHNYKMVGIEARGPRAVEVVIALAHNVEG